MMRIALLLCREVDMLRDLDRKLRWYMHAITRVRLPEVIWRVSRKSVCLFLIVVVTASFGAGLPLCMRSAVSADAGAWSVVGTPGSQSARNDILNPVVSGLPTGSEIHDMASGNDGQTIAAVVTVNAKAIDPAAASTPLSVIYSTNTAGISWSTDAYTRLIHAYGWQPGRQVFNIAIACDSSNVWLISVGASGPKELWITMDAGQSWGPAFNGIGLDTNETIRCMDISRDWGGKRDFAFATVGGTNGGRWVALPSSGFIPWAPQLNPNGVPPVPLGQLANSGLNFYAIKFSPTYNGNYPSPDHEPSVAIIYSDATATYYNIALRDSTADVNQTLGYTFGFVGIEVKNGQSAAGASPGWSQLNRACLRLPSDFRGVSASLRRAYISLDAYSFKSAGSCEDGILRIDDTTVYSLMDTTITTDKSIYSIAYFGTYSSGKLLVGERMGYPCTATVQTWFTDSPTSCPIPCWYPALKPATGAANQGTCALSTKNGVGAALVGWNVEGSMGLCATGSNAEVAGVTWYSPLVSRTLPNDESAFSISRNNAETWNQIGLIDTTIDWFNDVAPASDGTTVYIASVNRADGSGCDEFDSIWRSTTSNAVAAPLAVINPVGTYWERVFCRATAGNCAVTQSDLPLLRVINNGYEKMDGEIVAWAAQGAAATTGGANGVMAWSPDFGDYWGFVTPREPVQDFAFESSTTLYVLLASGGVQRMPYTGTSWSTNLPTYSTGLQGAHTITAMPDGKVLVGASAAANAAGYAAAVSLNRGETWSVVQQKLPTNGNVHVAFDRNFASNSVIYAADDNGPVLNPCSPHVAGSLPGAVYRNTAPASGAWVNIMSRMGGARGTSWWPSTTAGDPPHSVGQFGILSGGATSVLFSAHDKISLQSAPGPTSPPVASAVCNTWAASAAMPQPGIDWQCLNAYSSSGVGSTAADTVRFTLEPSSLKSGGNLVLYALDDEAFGQYLGATAGYSPNVSPPVRGCLWSYYVQGTTPAPTPVPPAVPQTFWGTAYLNGVPAPYGSTVTAKVGAATCGSASVGSQADYSLSATANSGDSIDFCVNGTRAVESALFSSGVVTRLDLHTQVSYTIPLIAGWNLISLPLGPANTNIQTVLASLPAASLQSVWYYSGGSWQSYAPGAPSLLNTMEDGKSYWLMMASPATLTVTGAVPASYSYSLNGSWNMTGFTSLSASTVEAYCASIYGLINFPVYAFRNGSWAVINAGGLLQPGEGYWVNLSQPGVLTQVY